MEDIPPFLMLFLVSDVEALWVSIILIETHREAYPADGIEQSWPVRANSSEAEPQLPIKEVLPDERDEAEGHGSSKHVEDTCHVVNVQLAAHDLVLLVVANACQPQSFQFLHFTWKTGEQNNNEVLTVRVWKSKKFSGVKTSEMFLCCMGSALPRPGIRGLREGARSPLAVLHNASASEEALEMDIPVPGIEVLMPAAWVPGWFSISLPTISVKATGAE